MSSGVLLIVGLGNPGIEYKNTRHNAGAWFIERLASQHETLLRPSVKFHALHKTVRMNGNDVHLAIPTTFMNLSGQAVSALSSYYKIPPEQILIIHDEIDLPSGEVRLKFDGGHGGHNGLRDIIRHLNSKRFYRLRIGVGHPENSDLVHDYVLNAPNKKDVELIQDAFTKAEAILPRIVAGDFQKAMQELHTIK